MSSEQEPPHISMKEAVKLAGWKPAKNQTRSDLLVFGGWLASRWEWSRDIDVSLDTAIANSRRLGEDVRIVGNPKPADRKKVRGRKQPALIQEPPKIRVPEAPPIAPLDLAPPLPVLSLKDKSESQEVLRPPEAEAVASYEVPAPAVSPLAPQRLPQGPIETRLGPGQVQASSLLLQRFLIAASLCSIALFLGYYRLAGTLFVSVLLLADAFFIVTTSVLALRHRRSLGAKRRDSPVRAPDAQKGTPQAVG